MPTQHERRLAQLEQRVYGVPSSAGFTYHDRVSVDWLSTLDDDDFELVAQVVEHRAETGERPDLGPEHRARYEELDRQARAYLRERKVPGF